MKRQCGILMHISSLPGPDGIGSLGREAYEFADFLQKSGMNIWQFLPLGPTGYGESPYQSTSVYAGNPLLISIDRLAEEGFLLLHEEERYVPENPEQVDYGAVRSHKMKILRESFCRSEVTLKDELKRFEREESWVRDFAMFTAIKEHFSGAMWTQWPNEGLRRRKKDALHTACRSASPVCRRTISPQTASCGAIPSTAGHACASTAMTGGCPAWRTWLPCTISSVWTTSSVSPTTGP